MPQIPLQSTAVRDISFYYCIHKVLLFLWQDVEVSGDKDDSRCLHVNVLRPTLIAGGAAAASRPPPRPLLSARFIFDDHIRCMAARQRLVKGRLRARQRKMQMIARLLEIPTTGSTCLLYTSPSPRD